MTRTPLPLIHEAVTRQARLRPTAPALTHGDERVDYATLDRAADTFAHDLHRAGVRPGDIVAVLLPRTPRLVTVLLAVLKCGAAYAALDRRWPRARIERILELTSAGLVVSDGETYPDRPSWSPPEEPVAAAAARRQAPPAVLIDSSRPATVFLTSGSTGDPRCVLSPHRATTRLFTGDDVTGLGPRRVMLQAAPVSWDAFTLEVWGALTRGAACAMAPTDYLLPDDLAVLVRRARVDTAWLTSSLFNLLVDEDSAAVRCFAGLRHVLTGGERLSPSHVARFLGRYPDTTLTNGYGPVESCVFATTHRITADDCVRPGGIPVGRPVPGTGVLVADGEGIAAPGAVGEITLTGDGLAVGYLGEPAAIAFTTRVVAGRPQRVYRTGDLGRLDDDGVLHFAGRADRQVKLAGHRIEPGEIEATARLIDGVRDVAVVAVPAPGGGYDRLAMFYTGDPSASPAPDVVRRVLAERLPSPLVPHTVRHRSALPTTITGKVDRTSLLASL